MTDYFQGSNMKPWSGSSFWKSATSGTLTLVCSSLLCVRGLISSLSACVFDGGPLKKAQEDLAAQCANQHIKWCTEKSAF